MTEPGLLGRAADLVPDALLIVRLDGRVLECNRAATRLVPQMRAGVSLQDVVADPPDSVRETLGRWASTGSPVMGVLTFRGPGGPLRCRCRGAHAGWVPAADGQDGARVVVGVHVSPPGSMDHPALLTDRSASLAREVAYRQRAAGERERLLLAEQGMRDRMQRLYTLSVGLASATTLAEVAAVIRSEAAASLGGITAVLGLFRGKVLQSSGESGQQAGPESWYDLDCDPGGMLDRAARSGGPVLITAPARPLAPYSILAADREHAAYCIPLNLRDQRLGVLAVALPGTTSEVLLEPQHVLSVAAQVAQAVVRARLFEHEHHLAERLQRSLLPSLPAVPRLTVAARYLPTTESVLVGGDWYDLFELSPGQVGLAIGDVAGHSLSEATVMTQLHNALRAIAMEHDDPGETLRRLNEFTHAFLPTTLATACYLRLDTLARRLSFASAGHLPPLLITAGGGPRLLWAAHGPPLGADTHARYPCAAAPMAPGDTLLLYTDGLVEQRAEPLDTGLGRLLTMTRQAAGLGPEALCELLTRDQPGAQWPDDRALLAVRFGQPGGR